LSREVLRLQAGEKKYATAKMCRYATPIFEGLTQKNTPAFSVFLSGNSGKHFNNKPAFRQALSVEKNPKSIVQVPLGTEYFYGQKSHNCMAHNYIQNRIQTIFCLNL
jgi:hypothetical protein